MGEHFPGVHRSAQFHDALDLVGLIQDVIKIVLQGEQPVIGDVQHAAIPGVPVSQRHKQPDGGQRRLGQRQNQPDKDSEVVGPVDFCRLGDGVGDGAHEVPHQQNIEHRQQAGHDHSQWIVLHPQGHHQQIGGNQSSGKQRGEVKEHGKEVPPGKILPAQNIAGHGGEKQPDPRARHRIEDGVPVSQCDPLRRLEDRAVGVEGRPLGKDAVTALDHGGLRTEGAGDDEKERNQAHHGDKPDQKAADEVKSRPLPMVDCCCQLLGPPFSKQRAFRVDFFHNGVDSHDHPEAQHRLQHPGRAGHAVVRAFQHAAVDIGVNDVGGFVQQAVVPHQVPE